MIKTSVLIIWAKVYFYLSEIMKAFNQNKSFKTTSLSTYWDE